MVHAAQLRPYAVVPEPVFNRCAEQLCRFLGVPAQHNCWDHPAEVRQALERVRPPSVAKFLTHRDPQVSAQLVYVFAVLALACGYALGPPLRQFIAHTLEPRERDLLKTHPFSHPAEARAEVHKLLAVIRRQEAVPSVQFQLNNPAPAPTKPSEDF